MPEPQASQQVTACHESLIDSKPCRTRLQATQFGKIESCPLPRHGQVWNDRVSLFVSFDPSPLADRTPFGAQSRKEARVAKEEPDISRRRIKNDQVN
jgi:hypothetical protein